MASLHRRPGSRFWYVSFADHTGKWRLISTKQSERRAAQKIAVEMEDAARLAKRGELTRSAALSILNEMVEASTGERLDDPSVREFCAEWLRAKEGKAAAGTLARYRPAVNAFVKSLGPRAGKSLRGVTVSDVENFQRAQLESGKAGTSANFDLKIVRIVLGAAKARGLIAFNPAEAVAALDGDGQTRRPFTPEEIRRLLDAAGDTDWRGAILAGALAGLRLADMANLAWDALDLQGGVLRFVPGKTRRSGKVLTVALHPSLREWLEGRWLTGGRTGPVFPSLAGGKSGGAQGLSSGFARLMTKANISAARTRQSRKGGRAFNELSFHSLRHSFVSGLLNAGVSADVRKELAGHSCDRAHQRYSHLDVETQRRAVESLPRL